MKKARKRKLTDNFDILLWAMWRDCGRTKVLAPFKAALEKASDALEVARQKELK
jgi:hypothetical protein